MKGLFGTLSVGQLVTTRRVRFKEDNPPPRLIEAVEEPDEALPLGGMTVTLDGFDVSRYVYHVDVSSSARPAEITTFRDAAPEYIATGLVEYVVEMDTFDPGAISEVVDRTLGSPARLVITLGGNAGQRRTVSGDFLLTNASWNTAYGELPRGRMRFVSSGTVTLS